MNFGRRKNVLQYDDVMNKQREVIYANRRRVLYGEDVSALIAEMTKKVISRTVNAFTADQNKNEWNLKGLTEELKRICLPKEATADIFGGLSREEIISASEEMAEKRYELRSEELKKAGVDIRDIERFAMLRAVDKHWMDHIDAMDQLKQGISLRSMAQRDPLQEFTMESYDMFEEMNRCIQEDTVRLAFNITVNIQIQPKTPKITKESTDGKPTAPKKAGQVATKKIGRNDPCPCGSGKKYKKCCGINDTSAE